MTKNQQTVLITGGAGYIGSHAVWAFLGAGWRVVVVDNLCTGVRENVAGDATFIEADIGDSAAITNILKTHQPRAVVHFAGSIVVPESVTNPAKYYSNNTAKSLSLLQCCVEQKIEAFLFSSTAAVYGIPDVIPVTESTPKQPINPYGTSKLCTEYMLRDFQDAYGLKTGILRYFNVAGADPEARTGQSTPEATHLIKVACEVASGKREGMAIFGTDYPTEDGTCVRDYIHVSDLADAHVQVLNKVFESERSLTFNCGYGHGYSVRQVLAAVEKASGKKLAVTEQPRRAGDPPALVADNSALKLATNWQPKFNDLGFIVETALKWEQKMHAKGSA